MTDTADLAAELDTVVRSVPGVITLYPATPLAVTLTRAAAQTVAAVVESVVNSVGSVVESVAGTVGGDVDPRTPSTPSRPLVSVTTGKAGLSASARIRVGDTDSATNVCRLAHDAIAAHLDARAAPIDTISVTVASIH
jgi:hypothetical protein